MIINDQAQSGHPGHHDTQPKSPIDLAKITNFIAKYAQLHNMRDWLDFVRKDTFSMPNHDEYTTRVQSNLLHYRTNYTIIALSLFIYAIISDPLVLVCLLFIGGIWLWLVNFWKEPLCVQGVILTTQHKYAVVSIFTVFLLYITSAGSTVIWTLGAAFAVICAHASFRDHHVHLKVEADHV
eukprot:TRINITY_DN2927_c2_g2::TRINITY_DN2927_c2_g2_i1::g.4628::m.4628 TRINITY_DN2927_c2_g2::TRINITY_DN2927_c2_g2_i1::g.4628  ORF type:complete len:181 (+),score=25.85,sp/Q9UI14/PRAF1_HUMAN/31.78/6e-17,PRA1/PF03208.14/1.4e-33,Pox_P21/PF05313.7/0.0026 TRINITY_DN2927_c2_g2_i1:96-638(+)